MTNKDLISQYVDTGLRIPEYQVTQLPNWAKKTYVRKRLIAIDTDYEGQLEDYEFALLDDEGKWNYYVKNEKNNGVISWDFLDLTPDNIKIKLINLYIDKERTIGFSENLFDLAPLELKRKWLNLTINKKLEIDWKWIEFMSDELLTKFVESEVNSKVKYNQMMNMSGKIFGKLPESLKLKIVNAHITKEDTYMDGSLWFMTPINLRKYFVKNLAIGKYNIEPNFYDKMLSDELKFVYLKNHIEHLKKIRGENWDTYLSDARHSDYNRLKDTYEQ